MTDFIGKFTLTDLDVCYKLIDFFENSSTKNQGACQDTQGNVLIDSTTKNCTDVILDTNEHLYWQYVNQLQICCEEYSKMFPYCNNYSPWRILEAINIQKYDPGQAFGAYHTERIGRQGIQASRHLVFMTYLNTVNTGGETEFYHQQSFIKPELGLTLIWPADWTHTHRGIPAPYEIKYIVTGWYNYVD